MAYACRARTQVVGSKVMSEFLSLVRAVCVHYFRILFPRVERGIYAQHVDRCRRSLPKLKQLRNRHLGETIFCLGNGPSLNQQRLDLLDGKIVLLTNRAFRLLDHFRPEIAYNVVGDVHAFNKIGDSLMARTETSFVSCHLLAGSALKREYCSDKHLYLMPAFKWQHKAGIIQPEPWLATGFSGDITRRIYLGYSVIFPAIQIAFYLGAKRVVMLGVDMNYTGDPAKDYAIARNDAPNWTMDYDVHAKPMFKLFVRELKRLNVEFLNATLGGRVDCVPRVSLETVCGDTELQGETSGSTQTQALGAASS
jgi:Protein of unknown function DUF115